MAFVNVNGIKLHYKMQGQGPRLLFIPGLGADFNNPLNIFASPLVARFTVLAFEPRGVGESDSPLAAFTLRDLADDAAGLALAVGWADYHVLGVSMGGMVTQELVLHYPAAVNKLVLIGTNGGGEKAASFKVEQLEFMSVRDTLMAADTRQDDAWADTHPALVAEAERQSAADKAERQANPALRRGYDHQVQAIMAHNTLARLAQIKAQTLVLGGIYDGIAPLEKAQAFARQIPNARLEIVGHGHGSWFFDQAVWDLIIGFLAD